MRRTQKGSFTLFLVLVSIFVLLFIRLDSIRSLSGERDSFGPLDSSILTESVIFHTAVLVEGRYVPKKVRFVIQNAMERLSLQWRIVLRCSPEHFSEYAQFLEHFLLYSNRFQIMALNQTLKNPNQYSTLVKTTEFWNDLDGEFVLVFQTDSVMCKSSSFIVEDFFQFDFIGGPDVEHRKIFSWMNQTEFPFSNGGFSLRRRSSMIEAIEAFPPEPVISRHIRNKSYIYDWPEDLFFVETLHRLEKPIALQNFQLGRHFTASYRYLHAKNTFGAHKISESLLPKVLKYCPEYEQLVSIQD